MKKLIIINITLTIFACRSIDTELKDVLVFSKSGAMLYYREGNEIKIKACKEPLVVKNTTTPGEACELKPGTDIQVVNVFDFKKDLLHGLKLSVNNNPYTKYNAEKLGKEEMAKLEEQQSREKLAETEALKQDILRAKQWIQSSYSSENIKYVSKEEINFTLGDLEKLEQNPNPLEKDIDPINIVIGKLVDEMVSKPGVFIVKADGESNLFHNLLESYVTKEWVKKSPDSNFYGMEFVEIPAGSFNMGSPPTEIGRTSFEKLHPVSISKSFEISKYEVTQGQWKAVIGKNPSSFRGSHDLPVERVSWDDVQVFIQKLNNGISRCGDTSFDEGFKKAFSTSGCYRLPTEEEWEYAARAETETPFYTGDNITSDQANFDGSYPYKGTRRGKYRRTTLSVKDKTELDASNPWGLVHMSGNVSEWTQDIFGEYSVDGKDRIYTDSVDKGSRRSIRGGAWHNESWSVRSANRSRRMVDEKSNGVGFRVVRTL